MAAGTKYLCFTEIKPDNSRDSGLVDVVGDCVPEPRSGHRIVVDHGNLYSIGGYNPDFSERENDNDTYYPLFKVLLCFFVFLAGLLEYRIQRTQCIQRTWRYRTAAAAAGCRRRPVASVISDQ